MQVNAIKQIILIVLLATLALALISFAFKDTFANITFDLPSVFTVFSQKLFGG